MPDIHHQFPIAGAAESVFLTVSTPEGLDTWWTEHATGEPGLGARYELGFGPDHQWAAVVVRYVPSVEFELELVEADQDWLGSRVGFDLEEVDGRTQLRFLHSGWPEANDHYRTSCYCWAMYLRLLKRHVESGEVVAYPDRLEA